jgi:hypothetical protein
MGAKDFEGWISLVELVRLDVTVIVDNETDGAIKIGPIP